MIKRYEGEPIAFTINGTLEAGQTLEAVYKTDFAPTSTPCTVQAVTGGWVVTIPNGSTLPKGGYDLTIIVKQSGATVASKKIDFVIIPI
jgi:hypothetical protein